MVPEEEPIVKSMVLKRKINIFYRQKDDPFDGPRQLLLEWFECWKAQQRSRILVAHRVPPRNQQNGGNGLRGQPSRRVLTLANQSSSISDNAKTRCDGLSRLADNETRVSGKAWSLIEGALSHARKTGFKPPRAGT